MIINLLALIGLATITINTIEFTLGLLESRSKIRGPRSMATRLTPHEYSLKFQRSEWERRRRDRQGV